jgi:4-amino-4-deoxy-L-arabinose transferase-like glycosyltransferase
MFFKKNKFIIVILLFSAILRFYKLDWGQGIFTHPDEYHIVGSVAQLSFPNQMNPQFFSYGTVTIYLIYFTQQLIQTLSHSSFIINTFLIGRFYSALFSTLSILIIYKICLILFMNKRFSLIAAFLVGITPGLIQQAHFATPESALTFFLFGSLFFALKFLKQNKIIFLILASLSLGLALGVKISSIVFLPSLVIVAIIKSLPKNFLFKNLTLFTKQIIKSLLQFTKLIIITTGFTIITFAVVAPYVFLDFPAFKSNLEYEGGLAIGKFSVFYTRQFIDTIPILFQTEKILPFALGLTLLLFSMLGFFALLINFLKKPKTELSLIIVSFLSIFLTNAFLFAKWTRFIAPTLPFFAIFATFLLEKIYLKNKFISKFFEIVLLIGTLLWATAFFSIYLHPDIRIAASNWIVKSMSSNSTILVEGGNTIDIPLSGNFQRISLDFYNIETDAQVRSNITRGLYRSDYFLVQSRRVFVNHQRLPNLFPKTANFYNALFSGKLGFKQIQEFHSYPMLQIGNLKLEFPDENAEETWSVFDHPVIRIFKKTQQFSIAEYEKILEN